MMAAEPALGEQTLEGVLQRFEFGVATDHACFHAFDAARGDAEGTRLGPVHEIGDEGSSMPLTGSGLQLDVEDAAHMGVGGVADAQAAGRGGLLHAGGDVDRNAADAAFGIDAAAEQHAAGVDAHAHVQAGAPVGGLHFVTERTAQFQQRQAASHGALGVVLAGFVRAEGGQQVVARGLQGGFLAAPVPAGPDGDSYGRA